uniref:Uncharacterized protein n=1 Tax=Rhizophora mucronata TaxID=61149 RepID=A0A2P2N3V4_RHIMU
MLILLEGTNSRRCNIRNKGTHPFAKGIKKTGRSRETKKKEIEKAKLYPKIKREKHRIDQSGERKRWEN